MGSAPVAVPVTTDGYFILNIRNPMNNFEQFLCYQPEITEVSFLISSKIYEYLSQRTLEL